MQYFIKTYILIVMLRFGKKANIISFPFINKFQGKEGVIAFSKSPSRIEGTKLGYAENQSSALIKRSFLNSHTYLTHSHSVASLPLLLFYLSLL